MRGLFPLHKKGSKSAVACHPSNDGHFTVVHVNSHIVNMVIYLSAHIILVLYVCAFHSGNRFLCMNLYHSARHTLVSKCIVKWPT
jgi:hypothetical protein